VASVQTGQPTGDTVPPVSWRISEFSDEPALAVAANFETRQALEAPPVPTLPCQ